MSLAMNAGEFARVRSSGPDGRPTTRPVSGPPHNDAPPVSGSDGGVMASGKSTRTWEAAYRQYGRSWETTARSRKGDPAAAREMAAASWAVAAAWRQIAAATTLPWWTLAAIESAAGAFETQPANAKHTKGAMVMTVDKAAKHGPPRTLMQAHEELVRIRPKRDASLAAWLAYYQRSAALYAEMAEIDRGHHHECLYWAERERGSAEEIAARIRAEGSK